MGFRSLGGLYMSALRRYVASPAFALQPSYCPGRAGTVPWLRPAPGQTSGTVRSDHGAWSIVCDTPAGAAEQCALMQNVVAEDRPEIGLSVVVLKTADARRRSCACWHRSACFCRTASASMSTARTSAAPISCAASPTAAMPKWCSKTSSEDASKTGQAPPSSSSRRLKKASASPSTSRALPKATTPSLISLGTSFQLLAGRARPYIRWKPFLPQRMIAMNTDHRQLFDARRKNARNRRRSLPAPTTASLFIEYSRRIADPSTMAG
jgi:hypothetical protein